MYLYWENHRNPAFRNGTMPCNFTTTTIHSVATPQKKSTLIAIKFLFHPWTSLVPSTTILYYLLSIQMLVDTYLSFPQSPPIPCAVKILQSQRRTTNNLVKGTIIIIIPKISFAQAITRISTHLFNKPSSILPAT